MAPCSSNIFFGVLFQQVFSRDLSTDSVIKAHVTYHLRAFTDDSIHGDHRDVGVVGPSTAGTISCELAGLTIMALIFWVSKSSICPDCTLNLIGHRGRSTQLPTC